MRDYSQASTIRQLTTYEQLLTFAYQWHNTICLGIGSTAAGISTVMLVLLGMTDLVIIVVVGVSAPLLGGVLAYATAAFTRHYLENWGYGVAAVVGFLAGPLAFGGMLLAIQFLMVNFG